MVLIYKSNSMCQKELLKRAMPKDVEIDVEEQINIGDEDFSILDTTVIENVSNFSCIF